MHCCSHKTWIPSCQKPELRLYYGGGGIGLMGKLADAVIENGGKVTGVIPSFMKDEGWDHSDVEK